MGMLLDMEQNSPLALEGHRQKLPLTLNPNVSKKRPVLTTSQVLATFLALESPPLARMSHRQRRLFISLHMLSLKVQYIVFGGPVHVFLGTFPSVGNALFSTFEEFLLFCRNPFLGLTVWGPTVPGPNCPGPNCPPKRNGQSVPGQLGPGAQLSGAQ